MPRRRPQDTEVHAYNFIKKNLDALGWDIRYPERVPSGQVWTQNECLSNPEIRRCLGLERPENIVKVTERVLWVIEAKRSHSQLEVAVNEAQDYAENFRDSLVYEAKFVSGVAGNDIDSFLIRSKVFDGHDWVPITLNGVPATGLLSPQHGKMLFTIATPVLFGEVALMLWLLIVGARPQPSAVAAA